MSQITITSGDITTIPVDAIVNAANTAMRGGGGVDGAIHRVGGPQILRDCVRYFPHGLSTGDAGHTTAGDLPAKWVIHTVGPNWNAGQRDPDLLTSCYRRCLEVASELGASAVSFPLVSAGAYGWPLEDAARIAISALEQGPDSLTTILVAYNGSTRQRLEDLGNSLRVQKSASPHTHQGIETTQ